MQPTYIIIEPVTLKGKFLIAKQKIGGSYFIMCECKNELTAITVIDALRNDEFSNKLVKSYKQAAE